MEVLIILSVLCIAAYTAAVCIKCKGIPYSISETYFKLEHKFWFGATMWLTAGLLMPAILEVTPGSYQFTAFIACAGAMVVGSAPNIREELESKVHLGGAIACVSCSQLWVALTCPWVLLVWIAYLAYTAWSMKKNWRGGLYTSFLLTKPMFWVEVVALSTTYVTLLIV